MRYRCERCGRTKRLPEGSPVNLLCGACGGAEGCFDGDGVMRCVHCNEKRTIKKDKPVEIHNGCFLARVTGQVALWTIAPAEERPKEKGKPWRDPAGRFRR